MSLRVALGHPKNWRVQVRDLMIFIEARQTVASGESELQEGTLVAAPQSSRRKGRRK